MFRLTKRLHKHASVDVVVVGGGPSGLAVVGNLLEHMPQQHRQLWVDPLFRAGRVNARYREVPSNTKVDLFLKFAAAVAPFRHIVDGAPEPHAAAALRRLAQDQGCALGHGADLCLMLTEGLARHFAHAQQHHGQVTAASLDKSTNLWTVAIDNKEPVTTPRLVLCTGSSPVLKPPPALQQLPGSSITTVHLDTALKPSLLAKTLEPHIPATVAVVGASHSAILVLMNLYSLATTTHPHLQIKWFTRHKNLRYAKPMDGWILYDNTGLKGQAAQWARENLEDETFPTSTASRVITRLWTPPDEGENQVYQAELPNCTHIIQAIGYQRDPIPRLTSVERSGATPEPLAVEHDGLTGRFFTGLSSKPVAQGRSHIPGLFGAGIAFPERVTDPLGNVEHAVGFWKFMNFCKRVVPQWVNSPEAATRG